MNKPLIVTLCVYTLKGTVASSFSCQDSRYKVSKQEMHYVMCMLTLSTQRSKQIMHLMLFLVILVFVAFTQHCIQSN